MVQLGVNCISIIIIIMVSVVPQTVTKIAIGDYPMAYSDYLGALITKLAKVGGV